MAFKFLVFSLFFPILIMGDDFPESVPCDEYFKAQWGVISSPNYPFNYSKGRSCLQRIYVDGFTSQNPKKICFTFYAFQLADVDGCFNDYLEFPGFEGSSGLVRFCGNGSANRNYANDTRTNVFARDFCWLLESGRPFDLRFRSMRTSTNQGYFAEYEVRDATSDDDELSKQCSKLSPVCHPVPCAKTEFKCHNGVCIERNLVCDGKDDCSDSSDEGYWHARCPVNGSIESCSFEDDLCQFNGQGIVRNNTSPVGPRYDHTLLTLATGNFVYFDGNELSYLNYEAPPVEGKGDHCLSFWYYMAGYVGNLAVYITDASGRQSLAWFRSDDHGLMWRQGEIDLPAESFPLLEVRFEATQGSMENNNIAVDDISLLQGSCRKSDISCTFELGSCGWKTIVTSENHAPWTIAYDNTSSSRRTMFAKEHTNVYKMSMNMTDCVGGRRARLIGRPVIDNVFSSPYYCLRFSYFIPMTGISSLSASVVSYLGTSSSIWQSGKKDAASASWNDAVVSVTSASGPFQIAFDGACSDAFSSGVAIDNIELNPGFCNPHMLPKPPPSRGSSGSTLHPSGCSLDQYKCQFSSECVFRDRICDGKADCSDRSDETDCPSTGGELMPYGSHHLMANEVIIGVSIVCVAIFLTVVVVIVIAARRRSILLRLARVRMMRRCADSVINDHQFECFPGFMEPKPPPYDFLPPVAPSYALSPPPYNSQSSSSDGEAAGGGGGAHHHLPPPSYETETFVAKQVVASAGAAAAGGRDPEADALRVHHDDDDGLHRGNVRGGGGGIKTTSI